MVRGHVIASNHARGGPDNEYAQLTFHYINTVPLHKYSNYPKWYFKTEKPLIEWAIKSCKGDLYIVVGAIASQNKYYGAKGVSNKQHDKDHRINVPEFMWAVACCMGANDKKISRMYYGKNQPKSAGGEAIETDRDKVKECLNKHKIVAFPKHPQCES